VALQLRLIGAGWSDDKMVEYDMKTRRRGCRGAPSKAKNRKKWIAKIGAAEFAHRVGGPRGAPRVKTFGDGVGGKEAATEVVAGEDWSQKVAGASLERSCSVVGAAGAHRGGGSAGSSARKTVGDEAGGKGVATGVVAGASLAKSVAEAALDRRGPVAGAPTDGGDTATSGVELRDGAMESSPRGGGLQPAARGLFSQDLNGLYFGGCDDSGDQGSTLLWWIRMEMVGLVVLHVCSYVCDDRLFGLGLAAVVAGMVALGTWLRGDAHQAAMATARRRWRARPKEGCTRVSRKQRMELCWSRVFELMVAQGMAGEEARLRQELRLLEGKVAEERSKARESVEAELYLVQRSRDELLAARDGLRAALQEEQEKVRQLLDEYVKSNDLDPKRHWSWKLEPGWSGGTATTPAELR